MPMRLHVGSTELRGEIAAYAKRFDLFEVRGFAAKALKQAPSAATLRRWRKGVPPRFEFAVSAGPAVGKLKASAELETELEAMLATATTLEARVLVVPTAPEVTPSTIWRDRLAKLVDRLPRDASAVVWEPSGLWEVEDAGAFARKIGVTVAVDPSRDEAPDGPIFYGRLRAIGGTRAYSAAALTKIAANIGDRKDAYVVFETPGALKEAKALRGIVRAGASGTGGLGRLVRPRKSPIEVRDDDEQEEE